MTIGDLFSKIQEIWDDFWFGILGVELSSDFLVILYIFLAFVACALLISLGEIPKYLRENYGDSQTYKKMDKIYGIISFIFDRTYHYFYLFEFIVIALLALCVSLIIVFIIII